MLIQKQSPSIRPLTTAHLAQTMTLMGLTAQELRQKIETDVANNPALEFVEQRRCSLCGRQLVDPGPCPVCSRPKNSSTEEPIVFVTAREDFFALPRVRDADALPEEEVTAERESLAQYVLRQIAFELLPEQRPLAAHLLTSLDEDGLLRTPLVEFVRYHHLPLSQVKDVIHLIQRADPIGVGSTSPQEALLVQLEVLAETSSHPVPELAVRAVQEGLDLLSRRQYGELARLLGVSTARAREIAGFITENLNPYPARSHWGETNASRALVLSDDSASAYTSPDVVISYLDSNPQSQLVVEVVSPLAWGLRINPLFRKAFSQAPEDRLDQWRGDFERANLLIKCIQQRNHTIVRLMQNLVRQQRRFILNGDAHLEPITRASLAKALEVHESTISRAVSNKAVQLPNGHIVPLARFFDRSLHIRTALRQFIDAETDPLTDTQLVELLGSLGYKLARRTVAKYRSMEGILPAHLRQPSGPREAVQNTAGSALGTAG